MGRRERERGRKIEGEREQDSLPNYRHSGRVIVVTCGHQDRAEQPAGAEAEQYQGTGNHSSPEPHNTLCIIIRSWRRL